MPRTPATRFAAYHAAPPATRAPLPPVRTRAPLPALPALLAVRLALPLLAVAGVAIYLAPMVQAMVQAMALALP